MKHKHHITPRYAGGTDEPENLVEVTVTQHAMWHFANWQLWGNQEDKIAWKGLAGYWGKEEIIEELMKLGQSRIDYAKRTQAIQKSWDANPEWKDKQREKAKESLTRKDQINPNWREEHGLKIKESGGPQKSVRTRKNEKIGMFNPDWQKEMAGRAGRSNARNGTGFCSPEVKNCPIRKARGGRAGCLNRQGVKIQGIKHYPVGFEYRTYLSSDFVDYYVKFGIG